MENYNAMSGLERARTWEQNLELGKVVPKYKIKAKTNKQTALETLKTLVPQLLIQY
jgi:hypothetical protein